MGAGSISGLQVRCWGTNCRSYCPGAGAQPAGGGGIWGICPPDIFKTLHRNFDICKNVQRI